MRTLSGPHPNDRSLNHSSPNDRLMQLLSSASAALQKPDIELSLNASRRTFGAHPPSIPRTTARHNLATSFTRALLATHIHRAHSSSRHHVRVNARPSVLCIRSTMSNSQRTEIREQMSDTCSPTKLSNSSFSRGHSNQSVLTSVL
jgi:hypothetical protein